MNFKTNFSKLALLGNEKIKIYFDDKTVEFAPPNLQLYLLNVEFMEFKALFGLEIDDFNKQFNQTHFIVETKYDILMTILKTGYQQDNILKYLSIVFPNLEYREDLLYVDDKALIDEEFDLLIRILNISCAEVEIDPFLKEIGKGSTSKGIELLNDIQKKNQEKIDAIRNKNTKTKDKSSTKDNAITIDQIVFAIMYEFSLKIDDIYRMNMFTLLYYWSYISKVVDNQIQIVAAGNGNIKKFTYFIN